MKIYLNQLILSSSERGFEDSTEVVGVVVVVVVGVVVVVVVVIGDKNELFNDID